MSKEILKSMFENIYDPQIDPKEYIQKVVSKTYIQIVDGHQIGYDCFIDHIIKQREIMKDISFDFIYLIEEGINVASLHRVYATKINSNEKIVAEVHAFFQFKDGLLESCNERTRIVKGSREDEDLGRRK